MKMDSLKDLCLFCHESLTDETRVTEHNQQQVSSVGLNEFREICERFHVQWIDSGNGHDNKELPLCNQCKDVYQCMVHLEAEVKQVQQLAKKFETCLKERIAAGKGEGGTTRPSIPYSGDEEGRSKVTLTPPSVGFLLSEGNGESDDGISISSGFLAPPTGTSPAVRERLSSPVDFSPPPILELELQCDTEDDDSGAFVPDDDVEEPKDNQGQETGCADGPAPEITVIPGSPTMYQCNICKKRFKKWAHGNYHKFGATCSVGPFKCDQCGQGFKHKSHLKDHRRVHTGERPFSCEICGKSFTQAGVLTRHKRLHAKKKPFVFLECNGSFASAQQLKAHQVIHTEERPFGCKDCHKRFKQSSVLRNHMVTHSGERPFSCDQCGKSFRFNGILKKHLKTHSDEKPFKCHLCFRAFSSKKDLQRHLVVHTEEEPFKCAVCQRPFNRKDNLNRHFKSAHKE